MLATASGVRDCLKGLTEAIVKVVPAEHQAQVLSALGLTATASGMIGAVAGAGVSVVALAALIVCRAKQRAVEHDERTEELRARERTLAYLEALSTRIEQVYARQAAEPSAEQMIELVKAAVAAEFAAQRDQTAEELGLTADEVRDLTTQLGLFAAELEQLDQKIDLISEDTRHRPWLELRRPSDDPDLFLYRDMAIPFVGRDDEWNRLLKFLEEDKPFTWWRVIDAGGAGKSRIAQELCWYAVVGGWTAGFLQPTDAETWSRWRVTQDTLIVVDYVFARWDAAALGQIVDQIAQYRGPHRVRLLVLERNDYGPWWRSFARSDGAREAERLSHGREHESVAADRNSYGEPLTLPPIGEAALESVLRYVLETHDIRPDAEALKTHVQRFRKLDPKGRPLFAAFYADAVSRDPERPSWSRAELARNVIDQKILREHPKGHGQTPVQIDARHLNLLVLATLVGGIGRDWRWTLSSTHPWGGEPESVSMADALSIEGLAQLLPTIRCGSTGELVPDWDPVQLQLLAGYSGDFDEENPVIQELQPDPLGEALVLERLSGRATASGEFPGDAKFATDTLLIAAGELAPSYLSAWVDRARQDYPLEAAKTGMDLHAYQRIARWLEIPRDADRWLRINTINLDEAKVFDISPLAGFVDLKYLNLRGASVNDISPLQRLTKLKGLSLARTNISEVSALADLLELESLWLHNTPLTDVSCLGRLTRLQRLSLSRTRISDCKALSSLSLLQKLYLGGTLLSNLEFLRYLLALRTLYLWGTDVEDTAMLANLADLQVLDISGTRITDISTFSELLGLQTLVLEGTRISDISPLAELLALRSITLSNSPVSDVSPLLTLPNLITVVLPDGAHWNPQTDPPPAKYLP